MSAVFRSVSVSPGVLVSLAETFLILLKHTLTHSSTRTVDASSLSFRDLLLLLLHSPSFAVGLGRCPPVGAQPHPHARINDQLCSG